MALDVSVPASAQLAVTQELSTAEQLRRANLGDFTPPNLEPLPPVPNSSSLLDIMPYLMKLALADTTLLIRLVLAFSCMAISKSSGSVALHCSFLLPEPRPMTTRAAFSLNFMPELQRVPSSLRFQKLTPLLLAWARACGPGVVQDSSRPPDCGTQPGCFPG